MIGDRWSPGAMWRQQSSRTPAFRKKESPARFPGWAHCLSFNFANALICRGASSARIIKSRGLVRLALDRSHWPDLLSPHCNCGRMAMFEALREKGYQIEFQSHALAILEIDFPDAAAELEEVILAQSIPIEEIVRSGGGETKGTQRLRNGLTAKRWVKETFTIRKTINDEPRESISHKVDHVRVFDRASEKRYRIALEIEWNNKDPFFDRDLENFKRLHSEGGISVGVMITRGESLQETLPMLVHRWVEENKIDSFDRLETLGISQTARQKREVLKKVGRTRNPVSFGDAWTAQFVSDKFGAATTHWRKLEDRIKRGVGNPCPLLLIGLPSSIVTFGEDPMVVNKLIEAGAEALDEDNP